MFEEQLRDRAQFLEMKDAMELANHLKKSPLTPPALKKGEIFRVLLNTLVFVIEKIWSAAVGNPTPTLVILMCSLFCDYNINIQDVVILMKLFLEDFSWKAFSKTWMVLHTLSTDDVTYPVKDRELILILLQSQMCFFNIKAWNTSSILALNHLPLETPIGNPYVENKVGFSALLALIGVSKKLINGIFYETVQANHARMDNNFLWVHITCFLTRSKGFHYDFHQKMSDQMYFLMKEIRQPMDFIVLFKILHLGDLIVMPHFVLLNAVIRRECVTFHDIFSMVDLNNSLNCELFWQLIRKIFFKSRAHFFGSTQLLPQSFSQNELFTRRLVRLIQEERWCLQNAQGLKSSKRLLFLQYSTEGLVDLVVAHNLELQMNQQSQTRYSIMNTTVNYF